MGEIQKDLELNLHLPQNFINYICYGNHNETIPYKEWSFITENISNFSVRNLYTRRFAWTILTTECIQYLSEYLFPYKVLDAGCGSGYLCNLLNNKGISIIGYDHQDCKKTSYTFEKNLNNFPIINKNYLKADITNFDVIILSWPNYDVPHSFQLLNKLKKNQILIYNGEEKGGCTASDAFFDKLENDFAIITTPTEILNKCSPQFWGLNDRWTVYRKVK